MWGWAQEHTRDKWGVGLLGEVRHKARAAERPVFKSQLDPWGLSLPEPQFPLEKTPLLEALGGERLWFPGGAAVRGLRATDCELSWDRPPGLAGSCQAVKFKQRPPSLHWLRCTRNPNPNKTQHQPPQRLCVCRIFHRIGTSVAAPAGDRARTRATLNRFSLASAFSRSPRCPGGWLPSGPAPRTLGRLQHSLPGVVPSPPQPQHCHWP